jgi:hypothetical protein
MQQQATDGSAQAAGGLLHRLVRLAKYTWLLTRQRRWQLVVQRCWQHCGRDVHGGPHHRDLPAGGDLQAGAAAAVTACG